MHQIKSLYANLLAAIWWVDRAAMLTGFVAWLLIAQFLWNHEGRLDSISGGFERYVDMPALMAQQVETAKEVRKHGK